MTINQHTIFETERLRIRSACESDIHLFYTLWTNPEVMRNVGFPQGLPITLDEINKRLFTNADTVLDQLLVVELKESGEGIGECKVAKSNKDGIAEPDIKLLPKHWGKGYGSELWSELVSYQFNFTNCDVVLTTPNVENKAAIRMYEATGAVLEGEDVHHFPHSMQDYTTSVHCYIYRLYRADWQRRHGTR